MGKWIWINLRIGAMSFGGSGRMMLFHEAVVAENKWLSEGEFFEVLTLAQLLPGPNLVNLSAYISNRLFGRFWVAALAVLALTLPGALLGVLLVATLDTSNRHLVLLFQGFSLGSIALFFVFLRRMYKAMHETDDRQSSGAMNLRSLSRLGLALAVGVSSFAGVPLVYSLGFGVVAAWTMEFVWFR